MFSYCSEQLGQKGHFRSTDHALRGIHKNNLRSTYDCGLGFVDDPGIGGYHHSVETAVSLMQFLFTKIAFPIHCWSL